MRLDKSQDPIWMRPRTDLDTSSSVRLARKLAKSATKTSNKIHKPKIYNEAIDNLIYRNRWRKAIKEKS